MDPTTRFPGSWNIVLAGAWNPAIINPNWLGTQVFKSGSPKFELHMPLMGHQRVIRFPDEGLQIAVESGRLLLSPVDLTDASMASVQEIAERILELLEHTPLHACGINYGFELERVPTSLLWMVELDDTDKINENLQINGTTITRNLTGIEIFGKPTLNLKLWARPDTACQIDLNYNYDVESTTQGRERIRGAFQGLVDHAAEILSIYDLELDRPASQ